MRRKLFNLTAAISLVLCVATLMLWMWSYHRNGWVKGSWGGSSRFYAVWLANYPGRLSLGVGWEPLGLAFPSDGSYVFPLAEQRHWSTWSQETSARSDQRDPYNDVLPARPDLHQF